MAARLTTYLVVAIVAATLIAGLIVGAQRDDSSGPVDLIIHNAQVYTANDHGAIEQAIAVRGNKILHVGSDREIMRYRRPQTQVIDANGAAVLPGFNDAHASLIASGLAREDVPLWSAASLDELQERVSGWAMAHADADWIVGRGWSAAALDDEPTRAQLDVAVKDRPAVLLSDDGRSAWANSAAMKAARITRRSAVAQGGEIVRDRRGEPTGLLRGTAVGLVINAIPQPARSDRGHALYAALRDAQRRGVTSIHDFTDRLDDVEFYRQLRSDDRENRLARVYVGVPIASVKDSAALEDLAAQLPDDPLFKTGLAYVDGARPDAADVIRAIDARQWQVAATATTAETAGAVLSAFEQSRKANAARSDDRRHRLELVEDVNVSDLPALKGGRWLAVMAPGHLLDAPGTDREAPSLDLIHWPAKSLAAAGARLAFGSNAPVRPAEPLAAIAAAISRESAVDEAIALKSAINAWTSGAAWASFDEHRKGTLEPGMLADMVILSANIFKSTGALATARVNTTIFDGRIVYRRDAS